MVLRVRIGVVIEVEDDIWADTSRDTVAKCAHLRDHQPSGQIKYRLANYLDWEKIIRNGAAVL